MPEVPNNREGPQAREPSKCLNGQKYGERLAKEALLSPATRGAKTNKQTKNSDRAITPAAEAVRVPAYLMSQGSPQAKQLHHLHTQPSMGQSCCKQKSCVYAHGVTLVVSDSLQPVDCGLLYQGESPGKSTGAYWSVLFVIPS